MTSQLIYLADATGQTVKHFAIESSQPARETSRMPAGWTGMPAPTVVLVTLCGNPLPSTAGEHRPSRDELYRAPMCAACARSVSEMRARLAVEARLQAAAAVVAAFDRFIEGDDPAVLVEALAALAGLVSPGDLDPGELADLHDLMALADAAQQEAPPP